MDASSWTNGRRAAEARPAVQDPRRTLEGFLETLGQQLQSVMARIEVAELLVGDPARAGEVRLHLDGARAIARDCLAVVRGTDGPAADPTT